MQVPSDEDNNLTPAELEFVGALRAVEPRSCPLDLCALAFEAGRRRERASAARPLRMWRGIGCAASLAVAVLVGMKMAEPVRGRIPAPVSADAARVVVERPRSVGVVGTEGLATSAPLVFVPTPASARTLPSAPASALQRLLWIGVQP